MTRKYIIGSRGSELALWQANFVKDRLAENNIEAELKIIKTQGDRILNLSFDKLEGKGFFTKELEEELDSKIFYRANRKYIVNVDCIRSYKSYDKVKLVLELGVPVNEEIIISQENAPAFKKWISEI